MQSHNRVIFVLPFSKDNTRIIRPNNTRRCVCTYVISSRECVNARIEAHFPSSANPLTQRSRVDARARDVQNREMRGRFPRASIFAQDLLPV